MQVAAGKDCSLVLMEKGLVFWWGTCSNLKNQAYPIEYRYWEHFDESEQLMMKDSDFIPVRILTSWSETLSIIYLTFADTRFTNCPAAKKMKILSEVPREWESGEMQPPYIEALDRNFKIE